MVIFSALLAAAFGAMLGQRARAQRLLGPAQIELDEDAQVVMHLAQHEARSRGLSPSPLYLLYALVQDEGIAGVIRAIGGDVEAIEDRLFRALDEDVAAPGEDSVRIHDTSRALAWAVFVASRHERGAGCTELWGGLVQTAPDTARLTAEGGADPAEVLFALVHGEVAEPNLMGRDVAVVLVNDDITTQELVVDILREVFGLEPELAAARMQEAHTRGSGIIGRYPLPAARARVVEGHRVARQRGSPLWLRLEP
ncbi:MAG TPA: ATP-dependent Clp protease adaptor ClpS [Kofleriaceae bacterium]|nr:ATP-dependent Clp protease adaptor ClpS [Kofleriaceae bacterium]